MLYEKLLEGNDQLSADLARPFRRQPLRSWDQAADIAEEMIVSLSPQTTLPTDAPPWLPEKEHKEADFNMRSGGCLLSHYQSLAHDSLLCQRNSTGLRPQSTTAKLDGPVTTTASEPKETRSREQGVESRTWEQGAGGDKEQAAVEASEERVLQHQHRPADSGQVHEQPKQCRVWPLGQTRQGFRTSQRSQPGHGTVHVTDSKFDKVD